MARLRELGFVMTAPDPADRRRTLVWPVEDAVKKGVRQHAMVPVDHTIAGAIGTGAGDRLPGALAALELLGELIIPDIHRFSRSEPADAT